MAVVITQLPEFSSHGNLVKQFPPGVGFRDPRRLRGWLTLTPWLEGNGGEAHKCRAPGLCRSRHILGTPRAVCLCSRADGLYLHEEELGGPARVDFFQKVLETSTFPGVLFNLLKLGPGDQ